MIPTCEPFITIEDRQAVGTALRLGHVALGPEVEWFEEAIAKRTGLPYAVATSSGSAALHLAVKLIGYTRWSVPALTFIAAAEAVLHNGAELEIVDHLRPANISVNFYGHPPPPLPYGRLIEDACEGLGSFPLGAADITCLSFNGNKIITTGGGGMLLTRDRALADAARQYVSHCRTDGVQYIHAGPGFNFRMPAMNAALGLSQLARLDAHVASKRETAAHYESLGLHLLQPDPGTTSTFWMPVALLDRSAAPIIGALQAEGIMARAVWYPLHHQPALDGAARTPCEKADDLWRRGIILPCSVGITPQEREQVVQALRRALDTADGAALLRPS